MTTFKELNRKNNELHHRLNDENMEIMTNMVLYQRSRLSDFQVELIRQDLLDMALSAQDRHVPLSEVFGEDYKKFCNEIIENVKRRDGLWTARWTPGIATARAECHTAARTGWAQVIRPAAGGRPSAASGSPPGVCRGAAPRAPAGRHA
ncbi:MAG: hypothetical protein K6T68_13105 [Alicyclobacillus shizuokensis]|nr:hypothetical protein [Alicyclobacillus shizuokensis]